jgi:hypothetical protein
MLRLCQVSCLLLLFRPAFAAEINLMRPRSGRRGTEVTLTGTGLDGVSRISFAGSAITPLEQTSARIRFTVPGDARTGDRGLFLFQEEGPALYRVFTVEEHPRARILAKYGWSDALPAVRLGLEGFGYRVSVTFNGQPVPARVAGAHVVVKPPMASGFITVADAEGHGDSVPWPPAGMPLEETKAAPLEESKTTALGRSTHDEPGLSFFEPGSGDGSRAIAVHGSHLYQVSAARIGDQPVRFWINGPGPYADKGGVAFLPGAVPASGPVTLLFPGGQVRSTKAFMVTPRRPEVSAFAPARAGVGAWLAFSGAWLDRVTSVSFAGAATTDLQERSPTRFRVRVPAGAGSGTVTLTTSAGEAIAAGPFTLGEGAPLAYGIAKAYITQGIQDGSVPLVAGRPGVFRAFVLANQANTARPRVRVRLATEAGTPVLEEILGPPSGGVPTGLDEDVKGTYNLAVPGELIQPGLTLLAELVPEPDQLPETALQLTFPRDGAAQVLEVRPGATLALRIVPLAFEDRYGHKVTGSLGSGREDWKQAVMARFPVSAVDFEVLPPLETGMRILEGSLEEMVKLGEKLETERMATPGAENQNWHGIFPQIRASFRGYALGIGTPGSRAGRTSIGIDAPGGADPGMEIMGHELAHTKGRRHNWCGTQSDLDPAFPEPPAGLGGAAFDVEAMKPLESWATFDLMGYCLPTWVSAYTYRGLLDFFLADHPGEGKAEHAPQASLEVSGTLHGDAVQLNPALEFKSWPERPAPGDCTLEGLDARGQVLLKVPFRPQEAEEGGQVRAFQFLVPMTPRLRARLASLRVRSGHGTPVVATRSTVAPRPPVATAWGAGRVALTWDPAAWPLVLVRDPRSGAILADAEGGAVDLRTDAKTLELLLSDGVRTTVRRVQVRP